MHVLHLEDCGLLSELKWWLGMLVIISPHPHYKPCPSSATLHTPESTRVAHLITAELSRVQAQPLLSFTSQLTRLWAHPKTTSFLGVDTPPPPQGPINREFHCPWVPLHRFCSTHLYFLCSLVTSRQWLFAGLPKELDTTDAFIPRTWYYLIQRRNLINIV